MDPMAPDGTYTLYADRDSNQPWQADCVEMASLAPGSWPTAPASPGGDLREVGPQEYLTLPRAVRRQQHDALRGGLSVQCFH